MNTCPGGVDGELIVEALTAETWNIGGNPGTAVFATKKYGRM